jgi:hypothetical protein
MTRKRTITKRPTYAEAVCWIADNDNAGSGDGREDIQGYITTQLVSDLFGAEPFSVSVDIERTRAGSDHLRNRLKGAA